ncbi:ABC transporter substrate-binding protein [Nocardia aurea]|uniref:ABC transporter substrate-binding protein n=1 Tax=Nocardia aurea TaxID=2144174 RepID=UPI000D689FB6|nr:ABC transporter substrate-binding protein [Nocardia aurea]
MFAKPSTRWALLPAAALTMALVVTGCSSDSGSSTVDESVLGTPNKAIGEPIKIAFNSEGKGAHVDTTMEIAAARATASYVNDYLGGINGRPLEIVLVCENQTLPSRARDCANKYVQSDAVAVVSGPNGNVDPIIEVTSPAGLPYFNLGSTQQAFSAPNSYVMVNSLGTLVGVPAAYAKEKGFTKVAIVTIDVPAVVGPLSQLGRLVYGNVGATADIVALPPGTPDHTPQIQAALTKDPQMFQIIGDPAFCTSTLKAIRTLDAQQPIVTVAQCLGDETAATSIPGGYAGLLVATQFSVDPTQNDTKLFDAVIDKYTNDKIKTGTAPTGFQSVLGFARAMTGIQGEVTRATVSAHLSTMSVPQPMPLGAGATFQCGNKVIAIAPNICAKDGLLGRAQEDGTVVDVKTVDVSPLLKPPTA